jgi:hypothetical protein
MTLASVRIGAIGWLLFIPCVTLLFTSPLLSQPAFPDPAYPVPDALDVAIADFDGDGLPDAAISTYDAGGVTIALGRADGTLLPVTTVPLEPGVEFVDTADLNGDSRPDLVLANDPYDLGIGATWVILGRGDGTFLPATRLTTGIAPQAVTVGDFDEDGSLDLATIDVCAGVGDCTSGKVWVSPGNGDGTFRTAVGIPAGREPTYLVSGDFDEDGHLDLMVANTIAYYPEGPGDLSFLAGHGDGTFAPEQDVTVAVVAPHALAVGDFNADGHTDVAGINHFGRFISIYLGRGDGTFAWDAYPTGDHPVDLRAVDVNGDGIQDLATANIRSDDMSVLLGQGDGTFGAPIRTSGSNGPSGLGFADFDRDHRLDVVLSNVFSETALLLLGHGDGTFGSPGRDFDDFGHGEAVVEDFDGDGHQDLLMSNGYPFFFGAAGDLSLLLGRGDGTFGPEMHFESGPVLGPLRVADFDEDGLADVAVGALQTNEILILLWRGDGSFEPASHVDVGFDPGQIAAGDLNGDAHVDLVVVNQGTTYPAYEPADISVLLGRGDGTFAPEVRFSAADHPIKVAIADFNGDGHEDLAVTSEVDVFDSLPGQVGIFLGRGDGAFDPGQSLTAGKAVFEVLASDFDGDGRVDLAVDNRGEIVSEWALGYVSVFMGRGDGSFEEGRQVETGGSPVALTQADFNSDGQVDLLTANSSEDASALLGRGDGTFEPPERFGIQDYPSDIVARDVNGDGRPDIVSVGQETMAVLTNQSAPPNTPPLASIDAPMAVECSGPDGAAVTLDGSGSSDQEGSITRYEWFLVQGTAGRVPLGSGTVLAVTLPLGAHAIELQVTDEQGFTGAAQANLTVGDTAPPVLSIVADPSVLWPANHRLVPVRISWLVTDRCDTTPGVRLVAVNSSESDDAPGDADGRTRVDVASADVGASDAEILLRAERDGNGPGRTYEIVYFGTDASGNTTTARAIVSVPHDLDQGP